MGDDSVQLDYGQRITSLESGLSTVGGDLGTVRREIDASGVRLDRLEGWRTGDRNDLEGATGRIGELEAWRRNAAPRFQAYDGLLQFRREMSLGLGQPQTCRATAAPLVEGMPQTLARLTTLETRHDNHITDSNLYRDEPRDQMDGFSTGLATTDNRLTGLEEYRRASEARQADSDAWREDITRWMTDENARSKDYDTWRSDLNQRNSAVEKDIAYLHSNKLDVEDFRTEHKVHTKHIAELGRDHGVFIQGLGALSSDVQQLLGETQNLGAISKTQDKELKSFIAVMTEQQNNIVDSFNTKIDQSNKSFSRAANDLDLVVKTYSDAFKHRLDDHDKQLANLDNRMKAAEGDVQNVRDEIKASQKILTDRLDKSDKTMKDGFEDLADIIKKKKIKEKDDGEGDGGRGIGGYNVGSGQGNGGMWNISNNNNPFPRAPNYSNNYGPCTCNGFFYPTAPPPYNPRNFSPSPSGVLIPTINGLPDSLGPPVPPGPPVPHGPPDPPGPSLPRPRPRRYSYSREAQLSSWGGAGRLSIALSRQTGGGMFSKPKTDKFNFHLGGGAGGGKARSSRRGRSIDH